MRVAAAVTDIPSGRRDLLLGLATVLYVAGAIALLTADQPWTTRMAIAQTVTLFGCGALIVRRTQTPVIGWLLIVPGITFNIIYAFLVGMITGTGEGWARWLSPLPDLGIMALGILLVVFPTGRVETTAARWLVRLAVAGQTLVVAMDYLLLAGVLELPTLDDWAELVGTSFFLVALGGLVEQVRRYRTRPRAEQQQVKWFLLAIAGQSLYVMTIFLDIEMGSVPFLVIDNIATMLWPITILIAISRYRLYEIDRIISRTLGYGLVVAMLAGVFVTGVALVSGLLPTQDRLGVALTTLAVIGLFDPLRRRVTDAVDRRFDRRRYEAQQVVEGFGRSIRDTTDLIDVREQLDGVLARTVAPTTVAVWQPAMVEAAGQPSSTETS